MEHQNEHRMEVRGSKRVSRIEVLDGPTGFTHRLRITMKNLHSYRHAEGGQFAQNLALSC